jgi:hypothetical protein
MRKLSAAERMQVDRVAWRKRRDTNCIQHAGVLRREPELAAALQQAAAERALMRAELDEMRCELRVTHCQLEVSVLGQQ